MVMTGRASANYASAVQEGEAGGDSEYDM